LLTNSTLLKVFSAKNEGGGIRNLCIIIFSVTGIIQWPTTSLNVGRRLSDGLGLCFSVAFWRETQQDVRLDSSGGDNILSVKMNMITDSSMSGILALVFPNLVNA
jgi:hypothetical protein